MTGRLKSVPFTDLTGEFIIRSSYGSKFTPRCGSYGATTLLTKSGKEYVIWNSMGEVNLSEVIKDGG